MKVICNAARKHASLKGTMRTGTFLTFTRNIDNRQYTVHKERLIDIYGLATLVSQKINSADRTH